MQSLGKRLSHKKLNTFFKYILIDLLSKIAYIPTQNASMDMDVWVLLEILIFAKEILCVEQVKILSLGVVDDLSK